MKLIEKDKLLNNYVGIISKRKERIEKKEMEFCGTSNKISDVVNGYMFYGLHLHPEYWIFREWAPNATRIFFLGEFTRWQIDERYELKQIGGGNWEIKLPVELLQHWSQYHLYICWKEGGGHRIPAFTNRVVQDKALHIFNSQVWNPPVKYRWKNKKPEKPDFPLIYEAHVGMSAVEGKVESYDGFRRIVLPRIARLGYNVVQLMAIMEHPYYGSFGYHVSNFFAVSSRSGTPDELKELIDDAHGLGIYVIMDIVHSHAVRNENEGLGNFDGTIYQYFHNLPRGLHPAWDSYCFDYSKNEVLHFLLSNCKYWLDEYHFDGFRFDGVTSMLYLDHGLGTDFSNYSQYFDKNQDEDALVYLALANKLIHDINPDAITIAEEMSGYPGLTLPVEEGGLGFDYRLSMGTPDFWINYLKNVKDEFWHVGDMFYRLSDHRPEEKVISYAESHDQALVGDQTISFRLMGSLMYDFMGIHQQNIAIDRGIALHKLIRMVTISCAGNGYLNFMGNEFGHPEWIDFPREGNNWSHHYARRQWHLADNQDLRYHYLQNFDIDMIQLIKSENVLSDPIPEPLVQNINDQILIFKRGNLIFAFSFNPVKSFTDYGFEAEKGNYKILLNSDNEKYNGIGRIDESVEYCTIMNNFDKKNYLNLYLPTQTVIVFKRILKKKKI